MSNESYHILGASIRASQLKLGNGVVIFLKSQKRGKTVTIKSITREHKSLVLKIPPGTETSIYEFLKKTEALVYYADDKDKWARDEYYTAVRYVKIVSDGEKAPLKSTHYTAEQVSEPEETYAWCWLILNKDQFDDVGSIINSTGIGARAIYIRSKHSPAEQKRIKKAFKKNKWDVHHPPRFKRYDDWFHPKGIRELTEEELQLIDENFTDDKADEIEKIAKVMSEIGFSAVFDCLRVSCAGSYFEETIEFEDEPLPWKKGHRSSKGE